MVDFNNFNIQWLVGTGYMVLLLAVAHWFPWSWLFGRKLPRLGSYAGGCICLLAAITIYLSSMAGHTIFPIVSMFIIAGLAVLLFYGIDWAIINFTQVRRERRKEEPSE